MIVRINAQDSSGDSGGHLPEPDELSDRCRIESRNGDGVAGAFGLGERVLRRTSLGIQEIGQIMSTEVLQGFRVITRWNGQSFLVRPKGPWDARGTTAHSIS